METRRQLLKVIKNRLIQNKAGFVLIFDLEATLKKIKQSERFSAQFSEQFFPINQLLLEENYVPRK